MTRLTVFNAATLAAACLLAAVPTLAQPVIDGTADAAFYGPALSTTGTGSPALQNTRTHFGDGSSNPDPIVTGNNLADGGGSEINQVFGRVADGRLHVLVAGNLEGNFNKLVVFVDAVENTGGVNVIDGDALPTGVDSFCCGGLDAEDGALQRMNGLTFDAGFNADSLLVFTHGRETVNPGGNTGDYNGDAFITAADYTTWRDNLGEDGAALQNRGEGLVGPVTEADYDVWAENFNDQPTVEFWAASAHYSDLTGGAEGAHAGLGMQLAPRGAPNVLRGDGGTISDFPFVPSGNPGNSDDLLSGFTLPNLAQGELIDRDYVMTHGGCSDDVGADCDALEFEFALDIDPNETEAAVGPEGTVNESSHRRFDNIIDLQMAINNSNIEGVEGSGGPDFSFDNSMGDTDDPENVMTGIEFSIPLSAIGASEGGGDIRLTAFVNNGGFDFASNQFAGDGLQTDVDTDPVNGILEGDASNLGNALLDTDGQGALVTLEDLAGLQYVTVVNTPQASVGSNANVPEPASVVMVLAAVGGLLARRCWK